jgi:hypothetical protein
VVLADVEGEGPPNVRRIVFREVLPGDRRKAEARSNDAASGGGARDLRFNAKNFDGVFKKMFKHEVVRTRDGEELPVRTAVVHTQVAGQDLEGPLEYWPPTNARPAEGRVGRISSHPGFQDVPEEDPTFALFTELDDGTLHCRYATMTEIQAGDQGIAKHIAATSTSSRRDHAAMGYIDFESGKKYSHE